MTGRNFFVWKGSNANMDCIGTPCHCYGRICLMSKGNACNEGNVLIDGKAVCGVIHGWTSEIKDAICKELGFRGALSRDISTTDIKRSSII